MIQTKWKKLLALVSMLSLLCAIVLAENPLSDVVAEEVEQITPVYLPGFRHITVSDFVDDNGAVLREGEHTKVTTYHMKERLGDENTAYDNTLLSLRLTYTAAASNSGIAVAGKSTYSGYRLQVGNSAGTVLFFTFNSWSEPLMSGDIFPIRLYAEQAGVTNFLGKEILVQISFEYGNFACSGFPSDDLEDDMRVGFYINGKLYGNEHHIIPDCKFDTLFGDCLTVLGEGGAVTIGSAAELEEWNLWEQGTYSIDATQEQQVKINGKISRERSLTIPGDYFIQIDNEPLKKVVIYSEMDAHPDDEIDVRDLVATAKVKEGLSLNTWAGNLGVQASGANTENVRERLLRSMDKQESNSYSFDFLGKDVMPIGGFYGPHRSYDDEYRFTRGRVSENRKFENFLTEDWMRTISEAGVNLLTSIGPNYASTTFPHEVGDLMENAGKYGVGVFVQDSFVTNYKGQDDIPIDTLQERIKNYSVYDAFCGVFMVDEPSTADYPLKPTDGAAYTDKPLDAYGKLSTTLNSDLEIPCYTAAHPFWTNQYNTMSNYEAYIEEYCEAIQPKFLSWGFYPFETHDGLDVYFYNMDVIRRNAKKYQIPFWAAIQAGGQWNDDKNDIVSEEYYPDEGQFRWNVNTCLAYGVQGFDYFPLIQPVYYAYAPDGQYDFERNGLIGADGRLNDWYYYAQDINGHISAIDYVLMNSVNMGIILNATDGGELRAEGASIWDSSKKAVENFLTDFRDIEKNYILAQGVDRKWSESFDWSSFSWKKSSVNENATWREVTDVTGNAMIGCFNYNGKTALYVVNYDMENTQNIEIQLDAFYHVRTIREANTTYEIKQTIELNEMKVGEGILLVIE